MEQQNVDHYETLGVQPNATRDEVKKAYRQKAMEWHPDKNNHRKEESEFRFKKIGESYEVLSDPERRAAYDRYGPEGLMANMGAEGQAARRQYEFHPARDVFAEFFRGYDPFSDFGDPFGMSLFGFGHHHGPNLFGDNVDPFGSNHHQQTRPQNTFHENRMHPHHHVFGMNPFGHSSFGYAGGFGGFGEHGGYGGFGSQSQPREQRQPSTSISLSFGSNGASVSRSTTTRIVNGQRTSVTTVKDAQGNVTVTKQGPDGRQYTTVNGTAQQPMEINDATQSSSRYPSAYVNGRRF